MDFFVRGIGAFLPRRTISNETLAGLKGIDGSWIQKKTGIKERLLADEGLGTPEQACVAARAALTQADADPLQVDMVVVASSFHPQGSSSSGVLRERLGLARARALDLASPQFGFLDALSIVPPGTTALVVGAEGFSDATHLDNRRNCYLLSDGAGAFLISPESGFARLDPRGQLQGATRGGEAGDRVLDCLRQLPVGVDPRQLCLVTQAPPVELLGLLPEGLRIRNPYAETGRFLSAALPLTLHRLFRNGELAAGQRCLLLAIDHAEGWAARLLEIERLPRRDEAGAAEETSAPLAKVVSREALVGQITGLARELAGERSVCVGLRLGLGPECPAALRQMIELEVLALLKRRTRQTDTLFQLADEPCFVLVLRRIDEEDATRLCNRLRRELEDLDPAGELRFAVHVELTRFPADAHEAWSLATVQRLWAGPRIEG